MGYTTDFSGQFVLDAPLTEAQANYINQFSNTRRTQRATRLTGQPDVVEDIPDPVREAVGLPVGPEGAYFVGNTSHFGQDRDNTIIDFNCPPSGQPGLWCQWIAVKDSDGKYTRIAWDGGEKFYNYVEWLVYIIQHFIKPWGRTLNGNVSYYGDDYNDNGSIIVKDNVVTKF